MKNLMRLMIALLAMLLVAPISMAQSYPTKPVQILIGFNAGTSPDVLSRALASVMTKQLGQTVIVENRPGASSTLATGAVVRAKPDGYTLFSGNLSSVHPRFLKNNPAIGGKDLSPIGDYAEGVYYFFARTSLGVKSLKDLVAYSKANPGKLNFGGQSVAIDLMFAMLKDRTGLTAVNVRFKGPPITEMLNDSIDFFAGTLGGILPHIQAGKMVALFGTARLDVAPQIPLSTEVGLPAFPPLRFGLWGPPALPRNIQERLASEIGIALKAPEILDQWRKLFFLPVVPNPEDQLRDYESLITSYTEAARVSKFEPAE